MKNEMTVKEKAIAFIRDENWEIIEERAFEVVVKKPGKSYLDVITYCYLASFYSVA